MKTGVQNRNVAKSLTEDGSCPYLLCPSDRGRIFQHKIVETSFYWYEVIVVPLQPVLQGCDVNLEIS